MSNDRYSLEINQLKQFPTKFLVLYLLIGLLWITTTDSLLQFFIDEAPSMSFVQSLKGWMYIFITGLFFYLYLVKETHKNINFYQELQKNENELSLTNEAFNNIDQGLFITDEYGHILKVNKQFMEMIGLTNDQLLGRRYERVLQFKAQESYRSIRQTLDVDGHWEDEIIMVDQNGHYSPKLFTLHQVLDEQDKLTNFFGFLVDIKEEKQKDQMLYVTRKQLQAILEHSPLGLIACDADGHINVWNGQAEEMLGITRQNALQKSIVEVMPKILQGASSYIKTNESEGEVFKQNIEVANANNDRKYLQLAYSNLYDQEGRTIGLQVMFSDYTTEREFRREISYLEHFDFVTGLYNFNTFNVEAEEQIDRYRENQHAFMILDIDRFHSINQQYGTDFGDELIVSIAKTMKNQVRHRGLVARLKGDEFGIFIPGVKGESEVVDIVNRLQEEFQKPMHIRNETVHPTISIGISMYPNDGFTFEEIYQKGNSALKSAKVERNSYEFYDETMNHHLDTYFYENELHRAILSEEIDLYYQPKINMETGSIQGVEALARWFHPEQGMISPGVFIPIAEETGLIFPMTDYVLKRACEDYVKWREAGLRIPSFSVNISAKQFSDEEFVHNVIDILDYYDIPAGVFEIEITESITMDIDRNLNKLNLLREAGVKISIDDFGTGYSSLKYMRDLPVDYVKIDRSFIDMIGQHEEKNMVDFIVDLAKLCKVDIVGEGIETADQMNYLVSIGCRIGQGFYFSKPIPSNDIEQLYVRA
ncbi:sensor domain-containing protein [Tenuibacillus multivorans]|uniref:PAS domain S-box-containing protein/diguanylate cyclase (GGDEF) domain-containing protein n=1 Tax=Tenuibacillus multivorans TaxID=237069 RepID=A0A1H0DBG8_9BACI|nr:bifunctional diguanylate cyclase/phosphodiesterase [Tenuibacillus multivorans]GEL76618.1 GGDEF domain-containing protein [Tenuibacillus multivorans]SDN67577.1 PAS domain S-box-containing protein/diguanylate cyclase (GGDEF) domain-containing protein [Tenuibacillus multivorans]